MATLRAALAAAAVVIGASLDMGCGADRAGGGPGTPAAAGASSAASTAPAPAAPLPFGAYLADSGVVPSAPSDRAWYARLDDPSTQDNEAARDLAQAIAPVHSLPEALVYDRIVQGGGVAIFVGGAGHERDTASNVSEWIAPYARYVHDQTGFVGIQVDYLNWAAGNDLWTFALYLWSFREGVLRTLDLVAKAISAGAGEVRLYGHSKGGDIVQEVTWTLRTEPRVTAGVALGPPVWSSAIPDEVAVTRRAGLFHPGPLYRRDYAGKLVLFIRFSDRASHGDFMPPTNLPGPGHDYVNVLSTAGFPALLDWARFSAPDGWEDRLLGLTYDY